ncbi:MAG: amidohydrolase family protein [Verrucomicrobia bacterium]|nr:amidohydrolase family protein [Verrucomicrobiota bacterium]
MFSPRRATSLLLSALFAPALLAADFLPPGHRPLPPGTHALTNGTIVPKPGVKFTNATLVIRDGLIAAVGEKISVPADARTWDLKGATVYAGFIDAHLALGASNAPVFSANLDPIDDGRNLLTAGAAPFFGVAGEQPDRGNPGPGYDRIAVTPERRVVENYSPKPDELRPLRELGFAAANLVPTSGILRGRSAFVTLADGNPNDAVLRPEVFQHVAFDREAGRDDVYPVSLMGVIAVIRQVFFDAEHYANEQAAFQKNPARKRPAFNPSLSALQPARERKMRVIIEPGSAVMNDRAARLARELGLDFALVASGQEWRRPDLARATGATFIVPLNFPALPKLPDAEDWEQISLDQLRAWDWAAENPALLRREGREIALTTHGLSDKKNFRKNLRAALDRGLSESDALAALTTVPAQLCGVTAQLGTLEAGKIANLVVVEGNYFDPEKKVREVWVDGVVYSFDAPPASGPARTNATASTAAPEAGAPKSSATNAVAKSDAKEKSRDLAKQRVARTPLAGRGPITNPPAVLIRNATVWTCGPQGILTNADVLLIGGKVKSVGKSLRVSAGALVIDGEGRHVTPGLIDCHSHTAILGGVNEGTLPSTAMVRIGDVVNSETENIYQQLAGGLTCANLLHGSANPIGGQNQVIKLRDGAGPEELKFAGAPAGIKFALGENVKQANWGDKYKTRFPQSRMGVPTFYVNRFTAARQYADAWLKFRRDGGEAPRRDLELEALAEILDGKRLIHCHSYRQDEIIAFLRVCDQFGVRIGTLQHILEGYKVADEIAKHGAGASTFSDWWAYKFEVVDAIPYNGSVMRERGVTVSFNSDSSELARRMYLEAAKAVKYGGTPEAEALKFVTLNPAKQLGIEKWVGSLEVGKDADFALWSHSPLDSRTVCEQTWIDGKKYFDRALAPARFTALAQERDALIAKAKKIQDGGGEAKAGDAARAAFFRAALEQAHGINQLQCGECLSGRKGE